MDQNIKLVTTPTISDYKIIKTIGLVRGNTVRARHLGRDILATLRNIIGGEVNEYTKLMAESREQALDRMVDEARKLGANAVVSLFFTTSMVSHSAAEILVTGTAVYIEKE